MKKIKSCNALLIAVILLTILSACQTNIYLVRHAEKETGPNPNLTAAGFVRAQQLSALLADKHINEVLTTDSNRTKQTAQPTATRFHLPLTIYRKDTIPGFVASLKQKWGRNILIVSHSETIPLIVEEFGYDLQSPVTGFNRMKIIKRKKGNPVKMTYEETTYGNP